MSNQLLEKIVALKNDIADVKVNDADVKYLKNADEVEHTTSTGYGKELIPVDVLTMDVYEAMWKESTFLNKFPGFHGNNMGISMKVPVIGEVGFAIGNSEWTTGAGAISQGTNLLPTGDVTITQAPMILSVDISKKELNHSIVDLEAIITSRLAKAAIRTAESMIINADSSILSTGNVNCDDALPVSTFAAGAKDHRLLLDNGIREITVNGTAGTDYLDVGTLEFDDFINLRSQMGEFSYDLDSLLLLMNGRTYNKTLTVDEFKEAYQNGVGSTVTTGALQNKLAGVEYVVARDYPLTEADGKCSSTASNNTKGGFSYIYKPAVQWGYGQPIEIGVTRILGLGVQVQATLEFGFAIVNKKAGVTDPSVVTAINATV